MQFFGPESSTLQPEWESVKRGELLLPLSAAFLTGTYFMFDKMEWVVNRCKEIVVVRFKVGLV